MTSQATGWPRPQLHIYVYPGHSSLSLVPAKTPLFPSELGPHRGLVMVEMAGILLPGSWSADSPSIQFPRGFLNYSSNDSCTPC
jgi:hypothetical protein